MGQRDVDEWAGRRNARCSCRYCLGLFRAQGSPDGMVRLKRLDRDEFEGMHTEAGCAIDRVQVRSHDVGKCVCRKCNAKNEYANPNQPDGSYVCYECR